MGKGIFAKNIKRLRKAKGLSQGFVAKKIGISRGAIARWEKGETEGTKATRQAAADFFKVSYDSLYEDQNPPPQKTVGELIKMVSQRDDDIESLKTELNQLKDRIPESVIKAILNCKGQHWDEIMLLLEQDQIAEAKKKESS